MGQAQERGPARQQAGIVAGTPMATPAGWCPVERLCPGDPVLTFGAGVQQVRQVWRSGWSGAVGLPPSLAPVLVPDGALDNLGAMVLLAGQPILLAAELAGRLFGDPWALVPARALSGYRGIRPGQLAEGVGVVSLGFANGPVVLCACRALLLACGGQRLPDSALPLAPGCRAVLPLEQARHLVACLIAEEAGAALRRCGQAASRRGAKRL